MFHVDPHNARAGILHERLLRALGDRQLPEGLRVVLGGDGWMLRVISEQGPEPTYMGLNAGNLGFMLHDVPSPSETLEQIIEGQWFTQAFPRLSYRAHTLSGESLQGFALNDVYLERASGQTAQLRLSVDGVEVVERIVCDGVILATALGSTAYSFSAGGPACHPDLPLMQLTSICPHIPRLPPITLPLSSRVSIEVHDSPKRPVRLVSDGLDQGQICEVEIADAFSPVRLAWLEGRDPTAHLIQKLLRI